MKKIPWLRRAIVGALAGLVVGAVRAQPAAENVMRPATAGPVAQFADPAAFDFARILPAPPAAGSLAALADLEAVLQAQAWRTAEQVAWAKLVEKDSVFYHAEILGPWFTAEQLPRTAAFFKDLGDDLRAFDAAAKKPFLRPRPTADARVEPCVTRPASTSYPSGSAMQAFVWAELMAEVFPAHRAELIGRAHRAAWGRLLGGVHFPSDLVAGRLLAEAYLAEARKSAAFRAGFEAWRREVAARPKPAGG